MECTSETFEQIASYVRRQHIIIMGQDNLWRSFNNLRQLETYSEKKSKVLCSASDLCAAACRFLWSSSKHFSSFFWGESIATEAARRREGAGGGGGEPFGPIEWQSKAAKNSSSIRRTLQVLCSLGSRCGDLRALLILPSALAEHDVKILIATFLRRSQRAVQQIEALPETACLTGYSVLGIGVWRLPWGFGCLCCWL